MKDIFDDLQNFSLNRDGKRGARISGSPICTEIVEFLEDATPLTLKQELAAKFATGNLFEHVEDFDDDEDLE